MELARALTTRRQRRADIPTPLPMHRAATVKDVRSQISSPVHLISTTNVLSYNAPDIEGTRRIRHISATLTDEASSDTSARSPFSDDSDNLPSLKEDTSDVSSVDSSPPSPEPNHLSCYFHTPMDDSIKSNSDNLFDHDRVAPPEANSPAIPQRAPSHSKRAHVDLARKRSLQQSNRNSNDSTTRVFNFSRRSPSREPPSSRPTSIEAGLGRSVRRSASIASIRHEDNSFHVRSPTPSHERSESVASQVSIPALRKVHVRQVSNSLRTSIDYKDVAPAVPPARNMSSRRSNTNGLPTIPSQHMEQHPFGKEIEQLSAVAEEFTGMIRDAAVEEDLRIMAAIGLSRFDAASYMLTIGTCYSGAWANEMDHNDVAVEVGWI